MNARSWTAGHPFDAGMTVPVFDRCLETVSQAHPATGRPNAALLGGHMCRRPFGYRDGGNYRTMPMTARCASADESRGTGYSERHSAQ